MIVFLAAAFLFAALGLFLLARWSVSRMVDRRIAAYQSSLLEKHYAEVQNIYREMRGWRHDYHNHLQTMKAHLALGQSHELSGYLDKLENDLKSVDRVLKTGNVMLDAILNSKISLAQSLHIPVNAKAQVPAALAVSEIDLCVMIGNLLDNAMESCAQIADGKDRFIRIYVGVLKQQLYISVSNSIGGEVKRFGRDYLSTKGGSRGFGLRRIDAIADRYGGYVNRQNEPGVFAAEIMLPL